MGFAAFAVKMFAGRYRIESLIGAGGFGRVYRAHHVSLARPTAIKVLDASHATTAFQTRFAREARAVARLDHPGCVRVFDHGQTDEGAPFLAMELLDGPTLGDAIRARAIRTEAEAVVIAIELLEALGHAHRSGVVHRDVKPGNVILARRASGSRAVLIDFGLARLQDDEAITAAGLCVGSPSYVAPERLLGRPAGPRSDLYAVGIILYELIAGVRPFEGDTPAAIARAHLDAKPVPLRLRASVSATTHAIVMRALARDSVDRFTSADEMLAALRRSFPRGTPVAAASTPADDETTAFTLGDPDGAPQRRLLRLWAWLWFGAWRWVARQRRQLDVR